MNISFALTTAQFQDGSKDVTRRNGWLHLLVGTILCAVLKGMGLKPGEKITRLGYLRVTNVRRERLDAILTDETYGKDECRREGFPDWTPRQFVEFFCASHKGCTPESVITRIEFVKIA